MIRKQLLSLLALLMTTATGAWAQSPNTNIVTQDNFSSYFDEYGYLLDAVTSDELIFQGDFSGSDLVNYIVLDRAITITGDKENTGDKAKFNDIGFVIAANGVTLKNVTLEATTSLGELIYVNGCNVTLDNISVTYNAPNGVEAKAIFADGAANFKLINSEITFTGANPGENHYRGLEVSDCDKAIINNNTISAVFPAVHVDWNESGIGINFVLAVGIQGGEDVEFTNNTVNVNTSGGVGYYPTIDAVMIHSTNNILIKGNTITHSDTTTENGARYYYSLDIYSTTGTVEANDIIVNTTTTVDRAGAYPIQLTGPFTITVKDNNLTAISKGIVAGIYSTNWGGAGDLTVENNIIDVTGYTTTDNYWDLVAGIEARVDVFKAYNNTITVDNGAVYDDAYPVYGVGSGSTNIPNGFSADIKGNNMTVDGKYAVYYAEAENANVTRNALCAHELTGDDAVYIKSGNNNTVENNVHGYVNMPKTGESTYNIPANVPSFKVYDDGGTSRKYSPGCAGTLKLTAPEGFQLQLSGNIKTEKSADYLTVYDGSSNQAAKLINQVSSSDNGTLTAIPTVISTGQNMTIYFYSNNSNNSEFDGLDLTVRLTYSLNETDGITDAINDKLKGKTVNIMFSRTFEAILSTGEGKASTLCLPFDLAKPSTTTVGTFYTFGGVSDATGEYVVTMNEVTANTLTAGTPYLIKPATTDPISFQNTVYHVPDDGFTAAGTTTDTNGWEFHGTYEKKTWENGQTRLYGFAAADFEKSDGELLNDVGAFRRFDYGYCDAFRCYLWAPDPNAARGATRSGNTLPQSMRVILVAADGTTTGIGTLDTKTGEVTFDGEAWYSLDGRRLSGKPTRKGIYVRDGRKVVIR